MVSLMVYVYRSLFFGLKYLEEVEERNDKEGNDVKYF